MRSLLILLTATSLAHADTGWRLSAGYAPMIGQRAEFRGFGNFTNPFPVPALAPTGSYIYRNGSVQTDVSGNVGNMTTFWSYTDPAQLVGSNMTFDTLSGGLNQAGSVAENAIASAAGFEISGYYHLGAVDLPVLRGQNAAWGLKLGYQYARTDIQNSAPLSASLDTITDTYPLAGFPLLPPGPVYNGPFDGIGYMLDTGGATRTTTINGATATIAGTRSLEVNLSILQFGSYIDIPLAEKLDLSLEGGALLGLASGTYEYSTTVSVPGYAPQTTTGSASRTRVLPGAYIGLGLRYPITDRLSVQATARYQFMREFELSANGSTAALNFNRAVTLGLSAVWRF